MWAALVLAAVVGPAGVVSSVDDDEEQPEKSMAPAEDDCCGQGVFMVTRAMGIDAKTCATVFGTISADMTAGGLAGLGIGSLAFVLPLLALSDVPSSEPDFDGPDDPGLFAFDLAAFFVVAVAVVVVLGLIGVAVGAVLGVLHAAYLLGAFTLGEDPNETVALKELGPPAMKRRRAARGRGQQTALTDSVAY